MHFVSKIDPATAQTPPAYEGKSSGFRRATYVERAMGSVHMGTGICYLDAQGLIALHMHSFEESYFIVSGRVKATADGETQDLGAGDVIWTSVGCIHSFENIGSEPVRWIETQAPLPPAKEVFRFDRGWAQYA